MVHYPDEIEYSDKYYDDEYEYRHVTLTRKVMKDMFRLIQSTDATRKTVHDMRLLSEMEWRSIGVQQSKGWQHYEIHKPEPHILLFRRKIGTDPNTGLLPEVIPMPVSTEY
jgi:cyclin-dependent kinase regulatory subunit CKS1